MTTATAKARIFPVSVAFVRHHLSAYVGVAVLLAVATVIATAEMVLFTGLVTGSAVEWDRFSEFDARRLRATLTAFQGILQVMCFTTVVVALVLVFFGFRSMLALRRRELGQMRLAGASVQRIRVMVTLEAFIFATVIVVPSVLIGQLLSQPFYLLLQTLGIFGESLHLSFGFPILTLLAVAVGMILCSVIAAWFSLPTRQTANVLEALDAAPTGKAAKRMSLLRIVIAALSAAGLAAFMIFMPDTGSENPVVSIIVPLLIVFPLASLAPLLVPAVARGLAWLLRPIIRGSGVLVAQRANRDSRRFASNLLPLFILVGAMGGFSIGSGVDDATLQTQYKTEVAADLIAQPDTMQQADMLASQATGAQGTQAVMRSASTSNLVEVGRDDGLFLTVFNFLDLDTYADAFTAHVTSGDLDDVGGTRIVSARETDQIGDVIIVRSPNGRTIEVEVGAVIISNFYTGLLLDWDLFEQLEPPVRNIGVFLTTTSEQTEVIASELSSAATVLTKAEYIQTQLDVRRSNASSGNTALFGTVYALAIVAMLQGVAASVLNRRAEYRLLSLLGISRPRIITTLLSETFVLLATSAVLLTAAFAFISWRYISQAPDTLTTAFTTIPWGDIVLTFAGMSALFITTVTVSGLAATRRLTA